MSLRCTAAGPCDAHGDGTASRFADKCPYYCDSGDCSRKAIVESRSGLSYCRLHAPRVGRPRSTDSKATAPIQFRVSATERAALTRIGEADGVSADQVAARITRAALGDQSSR